MQRSLLALIAAVVVAALAPTAGTTQMIHLSPVYRPSFPLDKKVLEIAIDTEVVKGDSARRRLGLTTLAIQDNQLIIARRGTDPQTVALGGRRIRDVVSALLATFKDSLVVTSNALLSETDILSSLDPTPLSSGVSIMPHPTEPLVGLGFGIVFALTDATGSESGVLSDAGFQLDLTGNHEFLKPKSTDKHRNWLSTQVRLGINANQQLNVDTEGSETGEQFGAALEQANQVSVTGQLDLTLGLVTDRMDLIISPHYGISWTQLDEFVIPPITVADTFVPADAAFEELSLTTAQNDLQKILPLSEIGLNTIFQFRRDRLPAF